VARAKSAHVSKLNFALRIKKLAGTSRRVFIPVPLCLGDAFARTPVAFISSTVAAR
jgi:hypothetical protein